MSALAAARLDIAPLLRIRIRVRVRIRGRGRVGLGLGLGLRLGCAWWVIEVVCPRRQDKTIEER